MLIRSQDRKTLISLDSVKGIYIGETYSESPDERQITALIDGRVSFMLGTYSTEEKAMDVLDMIAYVYSNRGTCDYADNHMIDGISQCPVFQMPKEEEAKNDTADSDTAL